MSLAQLVGTLYIYAGAEVRTPDTPLLTFKICEL